jgi:hypothetical protein
MNAQYSFRTGLRKSALNLVIVAAPLLIQLLPTEWANLTLSGAILLAVNYLKVKSSVTAI